MAADFPITIVGGGPVGLSLSLELSRYGVPHLLLNEQVQTSQHPKCNTVNARSMEHFRRLGVAAELRFGGLAPDYPTDIAYFTRLGGTELARIRQPTPAEAAAAPATADPRWPTAEPQHRISQIFTEAILLEAARARSASDIRFGHRVACLDETDEGVDLLVQRHGGRSYQVTSRWVVGCDGGRSFVRQASGISYSGAGGTARPIFGGPMVATYFRSRQLAALLRDRRAFMYWTLNPEWRSVTVAIDGGERFLNHIQAPAGHDPASLDPHAFLPAIAGKAIDVDVLSREQWNAGLRLVASQFRKGAAFLAGDSAHLFTPTGGFGMNTGIDDVANLAWKLAAVSQGWAPEGLLDSYEPERQPIAERNTAAASAIADVIASTEIDPHIEEDGPRGEAARHRLRSIMEAVAVEEFQTVGVQLGARYDRSPIIVGDGGAPPPDSRTRYTPSTCAGGRLPHILLDDGSPIHDRLGRWFTLVGPRAEAADRLIASCRARRIPLSLLPLSPAEADRLKLADRVLLVRPDQHIAWRGDPAETEGCDLVARIMVGGGRRADRASCP